MAQQSDNVEDGGEEIPVGVCTFCKRPADRMVAGPSGKRYAACPDHRQVIQETLWEGYARPVEVVA